MGIHFIPYKLTKAILEFKDFTIIEKNINEPEKEIDADLIFDCRGNYKRNKNEYEQLISPINTVLLSHKKEKEENLIYTKTIATPNGWTFIIPNKDSTSYGYLYNNKITSEKDATSDFIKRFDIEKVENKLIFDNYIAKNIFKNERTILQGNRYCFLEPLEANSLDIALNICSEGLKVLFKDQTKTEMETKMRKRIKEVETFLLWHYQFGSKYDTKFWEYAKSLPFNPDYEFKRIIKKRILNADYGQWQGYSFRNWIENVAIP
jgi:tryptophan halogenase